MNDPESNHATLVTGASGFVGQALTAKLRLHSHRVRAVTRASSIRGASGETVQIDDIGPTTKWSNALAGCDTVVHLAARVHIALGKAADADFHRINVEGTANLALQAARAEVRRFVFLSTVKVNGELSGERPFVESDPPAPADAYGRSKAQAEEYLRDLAGKTGMEVVILRPPLVYGPEVKANFLSLLRVVDAGVPLPLASVENRRSLVYVGNLVDAIETCLRHPLAANQTFFVSDNVDLSIAELVFQLAAALGRRSRLFACPPALLRLAGRIAGKSEQVARLTESLQIDVSRISKALTWRPPVNTQQGLAETASWYLRQKT
ncbi:MAG: UDP-glucose 4-epimerase family protein [Burkholderiales bacterium]